MRRQLPPRAPALLALALLAGLAGCSRMQRLTEEDCMTRVMYFESNRTSREGMIAVGTVVMNRKNSGKYPRTVCGVVGQKNQFAPGVLSKPMEQGKDLARRSAREVLRGARHRDVGPALFFHTAGYSYPYNNMHYVAIAGGNAFYEKRRHPTQSQADVAAKTERLRFEPPTRLAARREEAIAARMGTEAPPQAVPVAADVYVGERLPPAAVAGPAQSLATSSETPLPQITIEEVIAGGGLY